ncbi:hypothetical protein [Wolinella succinogenes]|uniref:Uncharacterized protein n=1 Tax=Wolinella succinogenes (strain ATCC 29543 / DSM 1740 / CCUG 13145 / JCM 31913 / LMG 7466 / NCTC 11488 / FDC 602W) TaxID=273121 RepID=Q7MRE7_WOLSU|nr:hypothetical protein [Wolinella succinogenes]CAE10475.1 hypothetical protein WS1411 [Wolinella succinogenes]VEG80619.1 Uncharacterised protein [Wolinella succinogenes]HCZ19686.1 hypothetical protein [Helicobacter sp.]
MKSSLGIALLGLFLAGESLLAHTALMNCFDNGDKSVSCEAGFSDGSSAAGATLKVIQGGKVVQEMKLDKNSEATFKKPDGEYVVVFDGGEGHFVEIKSQKILN